MAKQKFKFSLKVLAAFLFFLPAIHVSSQNLEQPEQLRTLMEFCKFSQAISMTDQYLAQDSARSDLLLIKGSALSALFRYKEAIATLLKALLFDSTNIIILNELVNVYHQSGDPDRAIETSRKIARLDPGNRYFKLQLANLCYNDKEYREAIQVLLQIYNSDTADFYVVKLLANCFDEVKRNDSAMLYYQAALKIKPYDPIVTGKLANLFIRQNEVNTAFFLTAIFLKKDPENIPILKINAYCNYLILDFEASAKQFTQCLKLGDSSKFTRKYLGLSYYKQNKYDSAAPCFRIAFHNDTTDTELCFYYGVSETRSLSPDTGLVYLKRALRLLMPSGKFLSNIYSEMAAACTGTGHRDTALILLREAQKTNPENNTLRFKIAYQNDYYLHKPWDALPWYREFIKNLEPQPEHDPREAIYGHAVVENGITEINISLSDYANNRIKEITGAGKRQISRGTNK